MKKRLSILLIFISIFCFLHIENTNGLEKNEITFSNLNSNHFVEFVKEKQISSKISKICTVDFCDYIRGANIDSSFAIFKEKYESFLNQTHSKEEARTIILKGFAITKVNVLN